MDKRKMQVSELEKNTVEELRSQLAKLDELFSEKEQSSNGVPTAKEIEDMWGELLSKTNEIYSHHISERLNNIDERPIIKRKK